MIRYASNEEAEIGLGLDASGILVYSEGVGYWGILNKLLSGVCLLFCIECMINSVTV